MKLVAYYRVSTAKQGRSGLGLEAQQAAVESFAKTTAGSIVASYTEVESGKKSDRPKLLQAIGHARLAGATLIVAKLDRLSRNVAFLSELMEAGVRFICCDNPSANELTIHILVAVAQAEAKAISDRTKAALQAYKARGGKLGMPSNLTKVARQRGSAEGVKVIKLNANKAYEFLYPMLTELRTQGLSYQAMADSLNNKGLPTRRGKTWTAMAVLRASRRATFAKT